MNKTRKESFAEFLRDLQAKAVTAPTPIETIPERKYYLIVTEGERTEPTYFNYFKALLPKHLVETINVHGEGDNTINIIEKAIALRAQRKKNTVLPGYDEVWAVYDKDDFPAARFNLLVKLAAEHKIESGHSNQSFELWYVLHFQFLQTALNRADYTKILSKILKRKYRKNDVTVIKALFEKGDVRQAIAWAKQLEENSFGKTPSDACPTTRVYVLVERLLAYTRQNV